MSIGKNIPCNSRELNVSMSSSVSKNCEKSILASSIHAAVSVILLTIYLLKIVQLLKKSIIVI